MAKKKGASSTTNGRDSRPKYRGIKVSDGSFIRNGSIILTQCGSKYNSGANSYTSRNFTIHSNINGIVKYIRKRNRVFVEVVEKKNDEIDK